MVSEDCGSVALSNPPHGDMQHTMGRLNVVLLNKTTNKHHPVSINNSCSWGGGVNSNQLLHK